jgi:hypothetical protein
MLSTQSGGPTLHGLPTDRATPGAIARTAGADERARKLAPVIKAIQAEGITSLNGIAEALNERRVPTPRGRGYWYAMQVRRAQARL